MMILKSAEKALFLIRNTQLKYYGFHFIKDMYDKK